MTSLEWKNVKITPAEDLECFSFNPTQSSIKEIQFHKPQSLKAGVEYVFVYNPKFPGKSKFRKTTKKDGRNLQKGLERKD